MDFSEAPLLDGGWTFERAFMLVALAEASYQTGHDLARIVEQTFGLQLLEKMPLGANQGFVAEGDNLVVLAYSGTNEVSDWLANIRIGREDRPWGTAHRGFFEAFSLEREKAESAADLAARTGKVLWITGHSLGGALSHIAAHELRATAPQMGLCTFGQPRTVDVPEANALDGALPFGFHRVVHRNDIVTRVPPNFPHGGTLVQLGRRRRLFGLEGGPEEATDIEPPAMDEAEFEAFQRDLRAVRRDAVERVPGAAGTEAVEQAVDRSVEGIIPGIRQHKITEYRAAILRLLPRPETETIFEDLLTRPAPDVGRDRRSAIDPSASLFDDAPEDANRGATRSLLSLVEETEQSAPGGGLESGTSEPPSQLMPVLVRLKDSSWTPPASVRVMSRMGEFVTLLASAKDIAEMERDRQHIDSLEISRPGGVTELTRSMPFVKARPVDRQTQSEERGANALVGIIDTGVDVMHDAFLGSDGQTRIIGVWDQLDTRGPTPRSVDPTLEFDFGRLYTRVEIEAMRTGAEPVPRWLRDPGQHGTHVAGIAAGRATGELPDGLAPDAGIIAVIPDMETVSGNPASLGYSVSHVNALGFLRAVSRNQTALGSPRPIAVNVSLGMNAGAHDGQTLLEAAFDGASGQGRDPGFVLVKSAGNERPHRGHTHVAVAPGRVDVDWISLDVDRGQDYLECWYDMFDELEFVLRCPTGAQSDVISKTQKRYSGVLGDNPVQMRLWPTHPDNGDNVLYISIRPRAGTRTIRAGVWTLEVRGRSIGAGSTKGLNIWAERIHARAIQFDDAHQRMTLSVPGTANHIVTVGATDTSDPFPGVIRASSFGPTRDGRSKPELSAPGRDILSAHANQPSRSASTTMTGTSMAAPHVTGAVALAMSRRAAQNRSQLNSEQISALLKKSARLGNSLHHHGFGYGILDVASFLDMCDDLG